MGRGATATLERLAASLGQLGAMVPRFEDALDIPPLARRGWRRRPTARPRRGAGLPGSDYSAALGISLRPP